MALHHNSLAQIPIQKYGSFLNYSNNFFMSKRFYAPHKKSPSIGPVILTITASIKKKVYEDESQGIICYQDESGEIICEGCDEGPSYRQISSPPHNSRDFEIINLLKQSWYQIAKIEENDDAIEGGCLQEDLTFLLWSNEEELT